MLIWGFKMVFPTVHLNGTSRAVLLDANQKAARAIADAIEALHDAAPNARDYYVQGVDAYSQAAFAHARRLSGLYEVFREVKQIIEHLENP